MRTTSLVSTPRTSASERPSRDQSKAIICSPLKSVRRRGEGVAVDDEGVERPRRDLGLVGTRDLVAARALM